MRRFDMRVFKHGLGVGQPPCHDEVMWIREAGLAEKSRLSRVRWSCVWLVIMCVAGVCASYQWAVEQQEMVVFYASTFALSACAAMMVWVWVLAAKESFFLVESLQELHYGEMEKIEPMLNEPSVPADVKAYVSAVKEVGRPLTVFEMRKCFRLISGEHTQQKA